MAKEISGTDIDINLNAPPDKRSYQVDFTYFKKLAPQHQPQVRSYDGYAELKDGLKSMRFSNSNFRDSILCVSKCLRGIAMRDV